MPNQPPLNPDALEAGAKALFLRERKYHTPSIECPEPPNWEDLTETSMEHYRGNARAVLAVAQPEVNSVEELVTTRTGLALANQAFKEGLSAGIRACNASGPDKPFTKPESPYSAPLLAMIKADRPEVNDA